MNFLYCIVIDESKILLLYDVYLMVQDKLFFIYVSKNEEWKKRYEEDWDYVSSLTRFF